MPAHRTNIVGWCKSNKGRNREPRHFLLNHPMPCDTHQSSAPQPAPKSRNTSPHSHPSAESRLPLTARNATRVQRRVLSWSAATQSRKLRLTFVFQLGAAKPSPSTIADKPTTLACGAVILCFLTAASALGSHALWMTAKTRSTDAKIAIPSSQPYHSLGLCAFSSP